MVCQRWWVTKWCVKDGALKMVGDKVGCERWCVKDGVWQSGVWKRVCQRWRHACHAKPRCMWDCATPATWNEGGCHQVPRLPRKVPRRHARLRATKPGPRAPPSAMSEAPATQNDRGCEIAPRLPRETKVDVTKCPACHAKCRDLTRDYARLKWAQGRHPVPWVPRLPRKTTVDVRLCHACHVNRRWMSPSATPATQSAAASRATTRDYARLNRAQGRHPVLWVRRLPRKTTVDVSVCEVSVC